MLLLVNSSNAGSGGEVFETIEAGSSDDDNIPVTAGVVTGVTTPSTNISDYALLNSPAFIGTPTAPDINNEGLTS